MEFYFLFITLLSSFYLINLMNHRIELQVELIKAVLKANQDLTTNNNVLTRLLEVREDDEGYLTP